MTTKGNTIFKVNFRCSGRNVELFIPKSRIDRNHYESSWDYWVGTTQLPNSGKVSFEVTGQKDEHNEPTTAGVYVNVYNPFYLDKPSDIICDVDCEELVKYNYHGAL